MTDQNAFTYDDMRTLIVLARLNGEESGRVHAAMLSILEKDYERHGKPVPGYVELLTAAQSQDREDAEAEANL